MFIFHHITVREEAYIKLITTKLHSTDAERRVIIQVAWV